MMNDSVEIQIQSNDDNSVVEGFNQFFEPLAGPVVFRIDERAGNSWHAGIGIIVRLTGSWADIWFNICALADRSDRWSKGVAWLWEKTRQRRPIGIVVHCDEDFLDLEMSATADIDLLKTIWQNIQQAVTVRKMAKLQGIILDKIHVIPDGNHGVLVIGYESGRPQYTINLERSALQAIPAARFTNEPEQHLSLIAIYLRALEYRLMLREVGYPVTEDALLGLVQSIEDETAALLPPSKTGDARRSPQTIALLSLSARHYSGQNPRRPTGKYRAR